MCSSHHIKSSKRWSKQSRWILNTIPSFVLIALVYNEPGARWKDRASSGTRPWDGALRWGEDGEDVLGIPEELHLGWRLWVCIGGVRLGAAGTQTGTGRLPKVLLHEDSEMRTSRRTFNPNTNWHQPLCASSLFTVQCELISRTTSGCFFPLYIIICSPLLCGGISQSGLWLVWDWRFLHGAE